MSDETQVAPEVQDLNVGTSDQGQPSQPQQVPVNQPNDPELMRQDYTRKTMELAEERRLLEQQRMDLERQRQSFSRPQEDPYKPIQENLVNQFGEGGAQAILSQQQLTQQQLNQIRFETLYSQEEIRGQMKYGAEWAKHNYIDHNGQVKNRVMEYRTMVNPITGKSLSLEEAWNLANPVDPTKIEKETKEKVYKEIQMKSQSTPATPSKTVGTQAPKGKMTITDAFNSALRELG